MARTLRLPPATEHALRRRALETGRSQNEIIVAVLNEALGVTVAPDPRLDDPAISPPKMAYTTDMPLVKLPEGTSIDDLLERDDRV